LVSIFCSFAFGAVGCFCDPRGIFFFLPPLAGFSFSHLLRKGERKESVEKVQEANKKEDFKVRKGKVYYA